MTPLMMASRGGHASAVFELLKRCKAVDAVRTSNGESSLLVACKNGEVEVAALLLQAGASPELRSKPTDKQPEGVSAADYAKKSKELASALLLTRI